MNGRGKPTGDPGNVRKNGNAQSEQPTFRVESVDLAVDSESRLALATVRIRDVVINGPCHSPCS